MSTATTAPYLVEHIENLGDIDTLGQIADGNTWSGFLVADEDAARKARTAIARTYIAGLRAGAR
ncbi:Uncharacterised protein [Mycobacteroides abscessus subsp. abscessus]|uniref:hypothetical protein n=1 Tax=Mycobacteroides abscessus TaxID=36809 RepID=UPI00092A4847|nr:hypothetical protein [Mycobacteroides abscessus]SIK66119.1 Uncharacterised protein [Mycobacteroides abscessus subsp. abscessus]